MKRTSLLKNFVESGVVLFPIFVGIFRSRGKDPLNKKLSGSRRNSRKLGKRNDIIRSGSFPIAEEFLAKTGTFQYLLIPKLMNFLYIYFKPRRLKLFALFLPTIISKEWLFDSTGKSVIRLKRSVPRIFSVVFRVLCILLLKVTHGLYHSTSATIIRVSPFQSELNQISNVP